MSKFVALLGVTALLVASPQPAVAQEPTVDADTASGAPHGEFDRESDTGHWLVSLDAAALAAYAGETPGYAATSPAVTGADRLDVARPASVAYRNHLRRVHNEVIASMAEELDRPVPVAYRYLNVLNGLAVEVSAAEAARLAELPGVAAVAPDDAREAAGFDRPSAAGYPNIWDTRVSTASIVASVDRAVANGVAELHYSVAAVDGPWVDMVDLALQDAAEAGIEVVAAPDRDGEPWLAVDRHGLSAAQTNGQVTEQALTIGNPGSGTLEWTIAPGEPAPLPAAASLLRDGEVTITHSASQAVEELNSVACTPGGGVTTDNAYLRQFSLAEFGITSAIEVTEVTFGVERVNGPPHPVTVNLYTMIDPDGPFTYANFEPIGSTELELTERVRTTVSVPVTGLAPMGSTLVVEVETPDLSAVDAGMFIGSDAAGQTAPSYLRSEACGLPEPTNTAVAPVNRPDMHVVMNVTGVAELAAPGCASPASRSWLSVSPEGGSIPAGATSELAVSFDSTGLAPGEYRTVLCLESNDPQVPRVEVPVTLVVAEELAGCDETVVGTHEGPLTVSEGVTCLAAGSQVRGEVNVHPDAGLVATAAAIQGPLTAVDATVVDVAFSRVAGPVLVSGGTELVSLFATRVNGTVSLVNNQTGETSVTVSGNRIAGSLSCTGNQPGLADHDLANTATTGKYGECAEL